jgi:hypothetical protein
VHYIDIKFGDKGLTIFWSFILLVVENTNVKLVILKGFTNAVLSLSSVTNNTSEVCHVYHVVFNACVDMTLGISLQELKLK